MYTSDLSSAVRPRLMVFTVLGILAVFGLSLVYAIRFVKVRDRRGVVVQGMYRSNFLILGLALAAGLSSDGDLGVTAVMGGDAALAGDIVVMTSALASLTLFGWSLLFKSLNLF